MKPGEVIDGKYRIETLLGQGGNGAVYRAEHIQLRSKVAVKVINPSLVNAADSRSRFLREARAAAAIRSPHVVQILDQGLHEAEGIGQIPYIVMEMLEGENLTHRLNSQRGRLPFAEVVRLMTHISRALGRAHELQIVHRDLKPDNIFIVKNDDDEITKVLDFGIAKMGDSSVTGDLAGANTKTGSLLGTPFYMSPEQAHGDRVVDWRSDLWAMAVITFQCVCGRLPYQSTVLGSLLVEICTGRLPKPSQFAMVPREFDLWFFRATQREPDRRFQSAREQNEALRAALPDKGKPIESSGDDWPAAKLQDLGLMETDERTRPFIRGYDSEPNGKDTGANVQQDQPPLVGLPPSALEVTTHGKVASSRTVSVPPPPRERSRVAIMLAAVVVAAGAIGVTVALVVGGQKNTIIVQEPEKKGSAAEKPEKPEKAEKVEKVETEKAAKPEPSASAPEPAASPTASVSAAPPPFVAPTGAPSLKYPKSQWKPVPPPKKDELGI